MSITCEPTGPEDLPSIAALLQRAFHVSADSPAVAERLLAWKYFAPIEGHSSPRSFALRNEEGEFLSHGCLWPVAIRTGGEVLSAQCLIDWASRPDKPGVGLALVRRLMSSASVLLSISGSDMTRSIMPRIGFQHRMDWTLYARVVRPWSQAMQRPDTKGGKEPLRVARNLLWSLAPKASARDWVASQSKPDVDVIARANVQAIADCWSVPEPAIIRHFLACPGPPFRYFGLLKNGLTAGYGIVSFVRGQARIAGLRILSADADDWAGAYSAIVSLLQHDPTVCEITAFASAPLPHAALLANGFRARDVQPIFIWDKQGRINAHASIHLTTLDDDTSYIEDPKHPFAT